MIRNKKDSEILESDIEKYFVKRIEAVGGLTYKFLSTKRGVPDRLVACNGVIHMVELKRPKGKPRESQIAVHKKFSNVGVNVLIIDSFDGVDDFVEYMLKTEQKIKTFEDYVKKNNKIVDDNKQIEIISFDKIIDCY